MATTKKTTTKKATAAKKTTAVKKTPVKKTVKAPAKKSTSTRSNRIVVNTNTSVGVRVFTIFLGILCALAFNMPIGVINGEVLSGSGLLELCLNPSTATGMITFILGVILPVGLFEISTILLIVKSDKLMSILAVMIDGIALAFLLIFMDALGAISIGWLVILFSLIVGIIFEIALFLIAEK